MSTIMDALDNLAEKVGVAEEAANDLTIADKIDTITAAISTPSDSRDIAEAVEKFGAAMPEYEPEYDLLTEEPFDWNTNYFNYFYKDGDTYVPVEKVDKYDLTPSEPEDWATNYSDYYVESEGVYIPVSGSTSENVVSFYKSDRAINYDGSETPAPNTDLYKGSIDGGVVYTVNATSVPSDGQVKVWDYDSSDNAINQLYNVWTEPQVPGSFTTSSNATTIKVQVDKNVTDVSVTTQVAPTWESNTYYSYGGKTVPTFAANTYYKKDKWQ